MLLIGWTFAASGATCGHLTSQLLSNRSARLRQWTTTLLAMSVSLLLCWCIGGSQTLNQMFYIP